MLGDILLFLYLTFVSSNSFPSGSCFLLERMIGAGCCDSVAAPLSGACLIGARASSGARVGIPVVLPLASRRRCLGSREFGPRRRIPFLPTS